MLCIGHISGCGDLHKSSEPGIGPV